MQSTDSLRNALDRLRTYITEVPNQLGALSDTELIQSAPGKWSRKEVLGHLIDSAINNLKRFTDSQFTEGQYFTQPYDQNNLVVVNRYRELPIAHLLTLWSSLNTQILYVVDAMPDSSLIKPVQVGTGITNSLGWLVEDYVSHAEHHLKPLLYSNTI